MASDEKKDIEVASGANVEETHRPTIRGLDDEYLERFETADEQWVKNYDKKVLRKVDTRLLPILVGMYLLNFLDRSNLAQARQGTLEEDLGMSGTDFNLATSIFFVGYLVMQIPSNMFITRVRPSVYLSAACALWGIVSTLNAAVHNFTGLILVRFFLGFVEAPFFPGAIFLMSSWYTRGELTRRVGWFYSGSALANMFGGILGAGVLGGLHNAQGLSGWRWLFIIEGTATVAFAIVAVFVLPDYPATTRWLNGEERAFAVWRLYKDVSEVDEQHSASVWAGLKMALKDYRTYLFLLLQKTSLLSQTFQYFFPSIVQTLGYGRIETLWLTAPVWFATFLVCLLATWSSAHFQDRAYHIIGLALVSAVGNIIATSTTTVGARFFAMFLMPMGAVGAFQIIISWIANSFPRPLVKRSVVISLCNCIGNLASVYGSYMYPSKDAPRYIPGGAANASVLVLLALLALFIRWIHVKENKKLERAETENSAGDVTSGHFMPHGFRYIY